MTTTTTAAGPLTATGTAEQVRAGTLSAVAATRAALDRIAGTDHRLGAFVEVRAREALLEARAVDERPDRFALPLAGVPVAVKDNVAVAGHVLRSGHLGSASAGSAAATAQRRDHPVVARLRAAGAVVVGLTHLPELGVWPFTDGPLGVTRNPWDLGLTAGGSSGGSAAAVAAGLVPLAHGNDGLGSIRIPAAACGLVGIKPGRGVVPAALGTDDWGGMAENGPLATSVEDLALALSVMAADPALADVTHPGRLRVALSVAAPAPGTRVSADWRGAALDAAAALREAGHDVVRRALPVPLPTMVAMAARWTANVGREVADLDPAARRALPARTRTHARIGELAGRTRALRDADLDRWRTRLDAFLGEVDVVLTPGLARSPVAAGGRVARGWAASYLAASTYTGGLHGPWNLAGYPAMSVPCGLDGRGRPLGVQLATGPGGERLLLGVAAQLEAARPWPRVAPLSRCAG